MKWIMIACSLLFSLNIAGQETIDSVRQKDSRQTLMGRLQMVQNYLDSTSKAKVDPHYIEVPEKPWRVILRYKETAVRVDYDNRIYDQAGEEYGDLKIRFEPPVSSSIGFWVGYRGTGLSFSKSLAKNAGRYYSFTTTGAKYGFNFRLRRFNTDEAYISGKEYSADGKLIDEMKEDLYRTYSPVWIRSVYLNGYYVFSGRRYSQAAAYNQSVIQRHSAGSLLLGATWYQSSLDYSDKENAGIMSVCHNIGRIKLHQANIGVGYGYNFVPFKGLVINAMVMPTVSVYNRVKVYMYDSNYDLMSTDDPTEDYGAWNPETHTWANGKTHKPWPEADDDNSWLDDVDVWETGSETSYNSLRLNVDLRMGIAYNWKNFFVGAQAQLNHFSYKKDESKVGLFDGYARLSLGIRL